MDYYMIVLRLVHILSIVVWAGWIFSLKLWINKGVEAAGPAGGAFMGALTSKTKLVKGVASAGGLAILSGLLMMDRVSGHFGMEWVQSAHGTTLIIGGLSAIIALSYGMARVKPAAEEIGRVSLAIQASGGAPTPEQGAKIAELRAKIKAGGNVVFWLILIAATCMAVARYIY